MDTTADRIKRIREIRNYSQKQLADKAGMPKALLQQYEYGIRNPKAAQLQKIATALEVDTAFLQPSKTDTRFAIYALLYDIIQAFGDVSLAVSGGKVHIGIGSPEDILLLEKLVSAKSAHEELSLEDFMNWLINQPKIFHNEEFVEKGNTP